MFPDSLATPAADDVSCLCPKCGTRLRRLARRGVFQRTLGPLFGFYPWECFTCREKRLVRIRGRQSFHRIWDDLPDESLEADSSTPDFSSRGEPSHTEPTFAEPNFAEDSLRETECSQAAPQDVA